MYLNMAFFISLKKKLKNITTNSDLNKYKELQNMCINHRIQFESFTMDFNKIYLSTILNICEFVKLKNNNKNIYYFNTFIHMITNKCKLTNHIDINDINITEEFAAEYFKYCLENPQIDLGWIACPLYKLNANMHNLLITL